MPFVEQYVYNEMHYFNFHVALGERTRNVLSC